MTLNTESQSFNCYNYIDTVNRSRRKIKKRCKKYVQQYKNTYHTYNFVDPDTGAHAKHIERLWREVRGFRMFLGTATQNTIGHLVGFMFKRKYGNHKTRLHHMFKAIAHVYSGNSLNSRVDGTTCSAGSYSDFDDN